MKMSEKADYGNWVPATLMKTLWSMTAVLVTITILLYVTHRECGVCKIAQQEDLMFLMPHMCVMDYPTIEYKGGKLIRTKTPGAGGDCCDFHVVKP